MFRLKSILAVLLLAAIAGAVPAMAGPNRRLIRPANPTPPAVCDPSTGTYGNPTVRAIIAGSSAMFQTVVFAS